MPLTLQLDLTVSEGREVECAKHLATEVRGAHWPILARLAAELVFEHERRNAGAQLVVIAGADKLRDLAKVANQQ